MKTIIVKKIALVSALCSSTFFMSAEAAYDYKLAGSSDLLNWAEASTWTAPEGAPSIPEGLDAKVYLQSKEDIRLVLDKDRTIGYMAAAGKGSYIDLNGKTLTINPATSGTGNAGLWFNSGNITEDVESFFENGTLVFKNTKDSTAHSYLALGVAKTGTANRILTFANTTTVSFQDNAPTIRYRYDAAPTEETYNGKNGAVFNFLGLLNTATTSSGTTTYKTLNIGTAGYIKNVADTKLITVNIGSAKDYLYAEANVGGIKQYGGSTVNVYGSLTLNDSYSAVANSTNSNALTELNIKALGVNEVTGELMGGTVYLKKGSIDARNGAITVEKGATLNALGIDSKSLSISNANVTINGTITASDIYTTEGGSVSKSVFFDKCTILLSGADAKIATSTGEGGTNGINRSVMTIENGAKIYSTNGFAVNDNSTLKINTTNVNVFTDATGVTRTMRYINPGTKGTIELNVEGAVSSSTQFQMNGLGSKVVFNASQEFKGNGIFWNKANNFTIAFGKDVEVFGKALFTQDLSEAGATVTIENFQNDTIFFKELVYTDGNIDDPTIYAAEDLAKIDLGEKWKDLKIETVQYEGESWLTIKATQIPEPAEWAMIFGVITFGFVIYRRKK